MGVTVRTVREIFKQYNEIEKLEEQDKMSFFVSMYQIYNESVFDLLNVPSEEITSNGKKDSQLRMRLNQDNFEIENLFLYEVEKAEDVIELYVRGI